MTSILYSFFKLNQKRGRKNLHVWSHLLIGDGVGHVGRVDHSRNSTQERHSSVDQPEVVLLILQ